MLDVAVRVLNWVGHRLFGLAPSPADSVSADSSPGDMFACLGLAGGASPGGGGGLGRRRAAGVSADSSPGDMFACLGLAEGSSPGGVVGRTGAGLVANSSGPTSPEAALARGARRTGAVGA